MKKSIYIPIIILLMIASCQEKLLQPINEPTGKPKRITVETVENIPGGARIIYTIPDNPHIAMFKAIYTLSNGESRETVVSRTENALIVKGFNDTNEHKVLICAITDALEVSDPATVTIQPLPSPLRETEHTVEMIPDFSGCRFIWKNPEQAPLLFDFYAANDHGTMELKRVITSSSKESFFTLREYAASERRFALVIRDAYGNLSDTISNRVTPLYEMKLDKKQMMIIHLKGDGDFNKFDLKEEWMIDDDVKTFAHSSAPPSVFTIDLGVIAKISRFKVWNRFYSESYYHWGNLRYFKVYGRADEPSADGNWEEWILLGEYEQKKPSGLPTTTQMTTEDRDFAEAGFEFEVDFEIPPLRYVRFNVTETWSKTSYAHPAEITFWGQLESN